MMPNRAARRFVAAFIAGGALVGLLLLWARPAAAYPWMIRHEYTGCSMCHADPSGGGVLTPYGRAQGDLLLRTRYGAKAEGGEEPSSTAGFLWGAFEPPEWLLLGGSYRGLALVNKPQGQPASPAQFIPMQADLRAVVQPSMFRAGVSVGFAHQGALASAITSRPQDNLVSREHWAGVSLADDTMLLRAGRIFTPFGVRGIEHTLWTRTSTRTDINDTAQHGVALAYNGEKWRGEGMALLGNYQVHPDVYRERGGAGFLEYSVAPKATLGVNALFTTAELDASLFVPRRRGAAGLMGRASPTHRLVLMAEASALFDKQTGETTKVCNDATVRVGGVAALQADLEVVQGVHALGALQAKQSCWEVRDTSAGAWLGAAWFFAPHADLRVDGVVRNERPIGADRTTTVSMLAQIHVFL